MKKGAACRGWQRRQCVTPAVHGIRSMPVMIAPMAMMRMAHADGEIAVANASGKHGVSMCLSTMATTSLGKRAT